MEAPCQIVSYDTRKEIHDTLLDLFREHNMGIDFVPSMNDARSQIKLYDYILMFIYVDRDDVISPILTIRDMTKIPILVVSGKYDGDLKRRSVHAGADEYFEEPQNLYDGLLSGIANIRRSQEYTKKQSKPRILVDEHIVLNVEQRKTFIHGTMIDLNVHEFDVLHFLFENKYRVYTYEQIYDRLHGFGDRAGNHLSIQHIINRVRDKIQLDGLPQFIKTHSSYGYSFDPKFD